MKQPAILPTTVFEVSQNLGDLPDSLRLYSLEWGVLFSVTGRHTVAQIGELLGVSSAARDDAFAELLERGLLRERALTYPEYLRAASTDDGPKKTLEQFLRSGASWGRAAQGSPVPPPIPHARPSSESEPAPPPDVHSPAFDPTVTRAVPTVSREEVLAFRPLEAPAPSATPEAATPEPNGDLPNAPSERKRMSLRALMGFILDRAPDMNSGQLDIYRVFIRVDTALLKRNGITTLRFEEDRHVVDPELQAAIASSLESTLGLACPQQVYV